MAEEEPQSGCGTIHQYVRKLDDKIEYEYERLRGTTIFPLFSQLFRKKSIQQAVNENNTTDEASSAAAEAETKEGTTPPDPKLKKCLTALDLIFLGVGSIIGAGIFVLTGVAARTEAGPAIMISYLFTGIVCVFSGLCYAEFAARVPISGSAYAYAYTTTGEFIAWVIGWNLVLEYTIGAATVARGWSGYLVQVLSNFNLTYPTLLYAINFDAYVMQLTLDSTAAFAVLFFTIVLSLGVRESTKFNSVVVVLTVAIILFIIVAGAYLGNIDNWDPFFPQGMKGIFSASATVFFSYIGFDATATVAEEAKNPQRDLPIGILGALGISTLFYILISGVLTLMVPYDQIDLNSPLATAFLNYGWKWASVVVGIGAFAALTTSIIGNLLSQPRIFFSMARDGLIPSFFARIHPKFNTPMNATLMTGAASAFLAFLFPIETLSEMVSIGTILAFTIVCISVLSIRYRSEKIGEGVRAQVIIVGSLPPLTIGCFLISFEYYIVGAIFAVISIIILSFMFFMKQHDIPKTFRTPFVPLIPILGIITNIYMIANLHYQTWIRFVIWMILGLLIYFLYSKRHSKLSSPPIVSGGDDDDGGGNVDSNNVVIIENERNIEMTEIPLEEDINVILSDFSPKGTSSLSRGSSGIIVVRNNNNNDCNNDCNGDDDDDGRNNVSVVVKFDDDDEL